MTQQQRSASQDAVLITGASSGIGQTTALYLSERGYRVFGGVRREADAQALRDASQGRVEPVLVDVTDPESIARAVSTIEEALAGDALHGLVNNAGIALGGPIEFLDLDILERQFNVNVLGVVRTTQAFLPLLRRGAGRIVNISSVSGHIVMPLMGPYAGSKFALEAISRALRQEVAPWKMSVSVVAPGAIRSSIWEKGRRDGERLKERLPPQALKLYGALMDAVARNIEASEKLARPPETVARAVDHALSASRPRQRYLVGKDAKLTYALVRLLPNTAVEWILKRMLSL